MKERVKYSIVIRPNEDIIGKVKEMKNALRQAIGKFFNSENSEAHITLFEFFAYERDYLILLEEFKKVVERLHPFELEFEGFNHFKNGAFYIEPTLASSKAIVERCNQFKQQCNSKLLKNNTQGWIELFSKPHMSIGRKLQPDWIEIAYSLFVEFGDAKFQWESITIRKFNENRGQFDVSDVLPMLGKGFSSDVQLNLF